MPFRWLMTFTVIMVIIVAGFASIGFINAGALNDEDFWKNFSSELESFDSSVNAEANTDLTFPEFFDPLAVLGQVLALLAQMLTLFVSAFAILVTLPLQVVSVINVFTAFPEEFRIIIGAPVVLITMLGLVFLLIAILGAKRV